MANTTDELADFEKSVLNDAETALTALQDAVQKGAAFIPKEVADVAADLLGYIKSSKAKIQSAGK